MTQPLQDAIAGIANVDVLQSSSTEGRSQITITFIDSANVDTAAIDVQRRVSAVVNQLPADADTPSVLKLDPGLQPVLFLALNGNMPLDQLFQLADDKIKPRLESQNGVASVTISGGLQREIQIQVDPNRLRAYGLTIDQVSQALARENQGLPSGSIDRGREQINLRVYGLFQSVDELRDVQIAGPSGANIRLGDVAQVVDTFKKPTSRTWLNGQEAVSLTVTKQSGSNEIATVDAVRAEIDRLNQRPADGARPGDRQRQLGRHPQLAERRLPQPVRGGPPDRPGAARLPAHPAQHDDRPVRHPDLAHHHLPGDELPRLHPQHHVLDGAGAGDRRAGRRLDRGAGEHLPPPRAGRGAAEAALKGRSEIGLAAIAITLVDVVVFTPVAFMSGTVGGFFRQFGLVIASATLLSLFVSFTLTPMLASRWLKSGHQEAGFAPWRLFVRGFEAAWTPPAQLRRDARLGAAPPLGPAPGGGPDPRVAFAMVPLGWIKFEFIPASDNGQFAVTVEMPPGSSLEATEKVLQDRQRSTGDDPGDPVLPGGLRPGRRQRLRRRRQHASASAASRSCSYDLHQRHRSNSADRRRDRRDDEGHPGRHHPRVDASGGGGGSQPVQVRITGEDPQGPPDAPASESRRPSPASRAPATSRTASRRQPRDPDGPRSAADGRLRHHRPAAAARCCARRSRARSPPSCGPRARTRSTCGSS